MKSKETCEVTVDGNYNKHFWLVWAPDLFPYTYSGYKTYRTLDEAILEADWLAKNHGVSFFVLESHSVSRPSRPETIIAREILHSAVTISPPETGG